MVGPDYKVEGVGGVRIPSLRLATTSGNTRKYAIFGTPEDPVWIDADRLVDEITHGGTTIEARGAAAIAKLEAEHREVVSAHATPAAMFLASIGKGVCRRRGRRRAAGGDRRAEPRGMAR